MAQLNRQSTDEKNYYGTIAKTQEGEAITQADVKAMQK